MSSNPTKLLVAVVVLERVTGKTFRGRTTNIKLVVHKKQRNPGFAVFCARNSPDP